MVVIVLALIYRLHQGYGAANEARNLVQNEARALVQDEGCLPVFGAVARNLAANHEDSVHANVLLVEAQL